MKLTAVQDNTGDVMPIKRNELSLLQRFFDACRNDAAACRAEMPVAKKTRLYSNDMQARHVFLVKSGCIMLSRSHYDGSQTISRLVTAGEILGLEGLADRHYRHDAVSLCKTQVIRLPVHYLLAHVSRQYDLQMDLYRALQGAVDKSEYWLLNFTTGTILQRLSRFIYYFHTHREAFNCLSYVQIACIIGGTSESVCRNLRLLEQRQLVARRTRFSLTVDTARLYRFVHEMDAADDGLLPKIYGLAR